ncbi:MAG: hypothetical protein ACTS5I_14075, partial [Rhodanobacter sp.]
MIQARQHQQFSLSGALLILALSLFGTGVASVASELSLMRAGFALTLSLLAGGAWFIANARPRTGGALVLVGGMTALALLFTHASSEPLAPMLWAAMAVIPAGLVACVRSSATAQALTRGVAFATVATGLVFLLQALVRVSTNSDRLPFDVPTALALAGTGWVFLSLDDTWQRRTTLTASMALCGIGWMVLLGWLIHAAPLIQGSATWVPMAFNTALAFVLLGHALWLLTTGRTGAAWGLALLCAPFALSSLFSEYRNVADPLGELLWQQQAIQAEGVEPGRLAFNTSLAVLITVFGLTATALAKRRPSLWSAAWTSGLLVSMIGSMALLGYLLALPGMRALGLHTPMSLPAAGGLLILGIGLVAGSSHAPSQHKYRTVVLPVA